MSNLGPDAMEFLAGLQEAANGGQRRGSDGVNPFDEVIHTSATQVYVGKE